MKVAICPGTQAIKHKLSIRLNLLIDMGKAGFKYRSFRQNYKQLDILCNFYDIVALFSFTIVPYQQLHRPIKNRTFIGGSFINI